jgi:cytoskeleton protein RodZ
MPPIGETLREARMRQELDIAEVEQATKIRGKYLRSLEAEEFDRLPGTTFVRTFLRTYAEYLGLDSQLLVEEYRQRHEGPVLEDPGPLAPPPSSRPMPSRERRREPILGSPGRGTMLAGAAVLVLLVLLVIGLLGGEQAPQPDGSPDPSAEAERQPPGGGQGGAGREAERPPPDDVRLRVTPQTETYLCVDDGDGERVFEGIISQPESFRAETLLVNLGNTQVDLQVNGERVPLEQGSNPVGFEFTPEGQEELPEGERPCA